MVTAIVSDPTSLTSTTRDGENWIVCLSLTRDVVEGVVACPLNGPTSVTVCQECRFLAALSAERRAWSCGAEPSAGPDATPSSPMAIPAR